MNECVNSFATPNGAFFCSFIHRDPVTNTIFTGTQITNLGNLNTMFGNGSVNNFNVNTGFVKTSGLDINADYNTRFKDWNMPDWGSLAFDFQGTYTFNFDVEPSPRIGSFDCAGFFGANCSNNLLNASSGGPIPKWRHKFRVTWGTPWDNISLSAQWRFISAVEPDFLSSNPILHQCPLPNYVGCGPGNSIVDNQDKIPAYNYLDLAAIWRVKDGITRARRRQQRVRQGPADPRLVEHRSVVAAGRQRQHLPGRLRHAGPCVLRRPDRRLLKAVSEA